MSGLVRIAAHCWSGFPTRVSHWESTPLRCLNDLAPPVPLGGSQITRDRWRNDLLIRSRLQPDVG